MSTQLRLTDPWGAPLGGGYPVPIGGLSWSIVRHDVGVLECSLGAEWDRYLGYECRLEVWRRLYPMPARLVRSYFVETVEVTTDESQRQALRVTALDPNALLQWRDIEAKAASANASKTDHADDLMRAFVREQMGASALDPIDGEYFTVEADAHLGPSLTVAKAWDNLLGCLQEISDESEGAGTRACFQVVETGEAARYQFQVRMGQLGTDRSASSARPLQIGLGYGNVSALVRTRDASGEVNHVLTTGQGQEDARVVGESIGAGATRSPWSRKKLIVNANDLSTEAALDAAAARRVEQGRPRTRIEATLAEAPGFLFGYHWGFGDRLSVTDGGSIYTGTVCAVRGSVAEDGQEMIEVKLEIEDV